jgi:hypothetical protein
MNHIKRLEPSDRDKLSSLLNLRSASDAILAYYGLEHPINRVKIFVRYSESNRPTGFVIVAQTGLDLFRPLVLPNIISEEALGSLLGEALNPMQPILLALPLEQRTWAEKFLEISNSNVSELLRLEGNSFNPLINVLVAPNRGADGLMRFEINAQSGARAAAGINWQGESFAEVYVETDQESVRRKFADSVLSALCQYLLERKMLPLLRYDGSVHMAFESLNQMGFVSTGSRILMGQAIGKEIT